MDKIFLQLLNMSAAAGWLVLAVMVLRLFMKKAPRWLTCVLWGMVAVRLLCPFFLESPLSLIPSPRLLDPYEVRYGDHPAVTTGIPAVNGMVNPVLSETLSPAAKAGANPLHVWITFAGVLWFLGFTALLLHSLISFLRIRKTVEESIPLQDNVRLCDRVGSPFILGIFHPEIYLPSDIREQELPYVLAHEKAHLKRRDHWWKPLGYLLLSLYWFHPLMWAAYVLFCRDIELACDESVIRDMSLEGKKAYSHALVSLSLHRRLVSACPLAFGESNIKERVHKVLHYKKPAFWMIIAAVAACVAAAVCFLTNPSEKSGTDETLPASEIPGDDGTMILYLDQWYKREDLSEDTLRWLEMYNSLSPEEQMAVSSVPWDLYALRYGDSSHVPVALETTPEDEETEEILSEPVRSALDQAIYSAVMERHQNSYSDDYDFACCDFVMLEKVSNLIKGNGPAAYTVTCYGWVFYQQYMVTEAGLECVGGCHIPTVLTFKTDLSLYLLEEYWEPRSGGDFGPDIRDKFPGRLADDALDSQKFIIRQQQSCYSQAVRATGLDTDAVIGRLLDDLCSQMGDSFDPQTIPGQQNSRYRELVKYGEYTLTCFLDRLSQGREPEPRGRIMALICEELLQTRDRLPLNAAEADTGRLWYETLLAHASNLAEPYLKNETAANITP